MSHLFYIARYGVPSGHNVMWKWKLGDSRVWCVLQQPADNSTVEDLKYSHKVTTNKARYKLAAQSVSSCICSASSMAMRACIQTRYTNPLAKHFHRLSLSITLQLYGWIWIVTSVFNISPLPSSRFYKTCLFSRKYLTKFVGQDDRHTAVRICSREVLRVILPAVSAKHKKKTQWKNIKVEAQLRSLCPLNELLTHAQSLCISLLSSFLRLERHWCVICCWKRVSSNHHLSISLKLYLLPQAYRPANDISRINFPLNLLSFQIRHTSSTACCRLLLTKEIVSHTSSTYFFGTLRSR